MRVSAQPFGNRNIGKPFDAEKHEEMAETLFEFMTTEENDLASYKFEKDMPSIASVIHLKQTPEQTPILRLDMISSISPARLARVLQDQEKMT